MVDTTLMYQLINQLPPEVLGQMIEEIKNPRRFVKKDLLRKEVPQYLSQPGIGGEGAPIRV